jgi:hypothetical protein
MNLRALYICYLSLEDPLVHTQVVAYLEGLAQNGHSIHLLTFDPKLDPERRRCFEADLRARGIASTPSMRATTSRRRWRSLSGGSLAVG